MRRFTSSVARRNENARNNRHRLTRSAARKLERSNDVVSPMAIGGDDAHGTGIKMTEADEANKLIRPPGHRRRGEAHKIKTRNAAYVIIIVGVDVETGRLIACRWYAAFADMLAPNVKARHRRRLQLLVFY